MLNLQGQTIGQYQLLEEVGYGGMATVYKAYQPNLDRYVALKIVSTVDNQQAEFFQRFEREAKAIANLNHPNILPVHDFGQSERFSYLAMRYIEGAQTLRHLMVQSLTIQQLIGLVEQVANALTYAHQHDIIHRDVKPTNVLIDNQWALLSDFGLAKVRGALSELTGVGRVIGTPSYMSPEQGQGHPTDQRADIYALGIIVYEMLTGQIPHYAPSPVAMLFKRSTHPAPSPRQFNQKISPEAEAVLLKVLSRNPANRYSEAVEFAQALKEAMQPELAITSSTKDTPHTTIVSGRPQTTPRLFITYKSGAELDTNLAWELHDALRERYQIYIEPKLYENDSRWVQTLEKSLQQTDYFIILLSPSAAYSEMLLAKLEIVQRLNRSNNKPKILPIRVAYRAPFPYPYSVYLNPLSWAVWDSPDDTPRLITELKLALQGGSLPVNDSLKPSILEPQHTISLIEPAAIAQPIPLEKSEGTMNPLSKFYIERVDDAIALRNIQEQGITMTIKAPRQMGKSSLLMRVIDSALRQGREVAFLDFQLFDEAILASADKFYYHFCSWLTDELDLDNRLDAYWNSATGHNRACTRYLQKYILPELGQPLLLAMDEVDFLFETDFRNDFFGMLRGWHNNRAHPVRGKLWKQFDLVLVTSTEPSLFIQKRTQSPFNVGETIRLRDFTLEQLHDLNQRHGQPLNEVEEQQLHTLLGGHPYLSRRALYLIASQYYTVPDLFEQAIDNDGPFATHLRYYLFRLNEYPDLIKGFQHIIQNHTYHDEQLIYRLWSAGLVRREDPQIVPRCQLYVDYFEKHL